MTGSLSYRNQSIDSQSKSIEDWFLYDRDLCHETVKKRIVKRKRVKKKNR